MSTAARLTALQRWLLNLQRGPGTANLIRRVERSHHKVKRDDGRVLRGLFVADDLCLTRHGAFYHVTDGKSATPISLEEVARRYELKEIRTRYRLAQDKWKYRNKKRMEQRVREHVTHKAKAS